jgi:hypothetical protein
VVKKEELDLTTVIFGVRVISECQVIMNCVLVVKKGLWNLTMIIFHVKAVFDVRAYGIGY